MIQRRTIARVALVALTGLSALPALADDSPEKRADTGPFHRSNVHPGTAPEVREGPTGDGVYGRFDGDLSFSLGLGAEVDWGTSTPAVRPLLLAALRFYQTAGLYVSFSQSFENGANIERSWASGLLIEPLFLTRWSNDWQTGRGFWDLTIDSLSFNVGAYFLQPLRGNFADTAGVELGIGLGVPLLAHAEGPWLRIRTSLRAGEHEPGGIVHLVLEWQGFWESGLIQE